MSAAAQAPRPVPPHHVHLVEPLPLGHGPLWLGYLAGALLPDLGQVTVTCPDLASYEELASLQGEHGGQLRVRRLPWQRGGQAWRAMFDGADRLGADLTLVTFLDPLLGRPLRQDPRRLAGSPVTGLWFCPPPRRAVGRWNLRWLTSRRHRRQREAQSILDCVPGWLSVAWLPDPLLVGRIAPRPGLQLHELPDPWPSRPTMDRHEARQRLGLPVDRTIFLHLGVHDERKGLADAAAAWGRLRDLPDALLLRAGVVTPAQVALLASLVQEGRAIVRPDRVAPTDMDVYLRACDWLLLPYRHHEGSSGLLAAAAAARRPVIAAEHGIVGARTVLSGLGLVYPHLSVDGLEAALRRALTLRPGDFRAGLERYAAGHRLADFENAVRGPLGLPLRPPPGMAPGPVRSSPAP